MSASQPEDTPLDIGRQDDCCLDVHRIAEGAEGSEGSINTAEVTLGNKICERPESRPRTFTRHLPREIIDLILSHLNKSGLAKCLRVSIPIHDASAPILYTRVAIDVRPVEVFDLFDPSEHELDLIVAACALGRQHYRSSNTQNHQSPVGLTAELYCPRRFSLGANFTYTTHLTLKSHNRSECATSGESLLIPNLVVLKILLYLCDPQSAGSTSERASCCPLISRLRPRRVVFRGTPYGDLSGLCTEDLSGSSFPANEMIIIFGTTGMSHYRQVIEAEATWGFRFRCGVKPQRVAPLQTLSPSLERLTLVADKVDVDKMRRTWEEQEEYVRQTATDRCLLPYALAMVCCGNHAGTVEMVGMETLIPAWSDPQMTVRESVMDDLRRDIAAWAGTRGVEPAEAERRSRAVIFTTGSEFVARHPDCRSGFLELRHGEAVEIGSSVKGGCEGA